MATQFDVRAYGATGDGVTDDTLAIQAAIDAATAAGGGRVIIPAGTFRISPGDDGDAGCLLLKDNVALEGAGMGATVLKVIDNPGLVTGIIRTGGDHVALSRLTIDGNNLGSTIAAECVAINGHTDVRLDAVEAMNGSGYGFDLRSVRSGGSEVLVRDCIAHQNGLDGFAAYGLVNSVLQDNTAYQNRGAGYNLGGSVQLFDSDAYLNYGDGIRLVSVAGAPGSVTVDGGSAYDNNNDGVHVDAVDGFKVNGLEVYGNGTYGIDVGVSRNGQVSYNNVHGNSLQGPLSEVWINGTGNTVRANTVTGDQPDQAGIVESFNAGNYNTVVDNVVSQTYLNVNVQGPHSRASGNREFVFISGTGAGDTLGGSIGREVVFGNDGNDRLSGGLNDDVLEGGAGSDRLSGGSGSDVFRFISATDSYRAMGQSHADRILDFQLGQDTLDLTALGYSGVGNGHNGTLQVTYSADKQLTYLKGLDADSSGNRFELVLDGNLSALTTASFQPMHTSGIDGDTVTGTAVADSLHGTTGRQFMYGEGGDDLVYGGAGGDELHGGEGADVFVFSQRSDSLRDARVSDDLNRDTIIDFDGADGDMLDVSALGIYALGDGLYGTLKLTVNEAGTRTVLKSLIEDRNGQHFEIALRGDYSDGLAAQNIIFMHPQGTQVYNTAPTEDNDYRGFPNDDFLKGLSGNDTLRGASGNDRLEGGTGNDVLIGGAGADRLTGGSGEDVFRYNSISESARSDSGVTVDTLTDFSVYRDTLNLRSLGFTGLGDGHDGTLQLTYNERLDRTYLTDLDGDSEGRHFQVRMVGDLADTFTAANLLVAAPTEVELLGGRGEPEAA